jgi:hypothetical protein
MTYRPSDQLFNLAWLVHTREQSVWRRPRFHVTGMQYVLIALSLPHDGHIRARRWFKVFMHLKQSLELLGAIAYRIGKYSETLFLSKIHNY